VLSARTVENAQSAYWLKFILNPVRDSHLNNWPRLSAVSHVCGLITDKHALLVLCERCT
jgi:Na+/proline symporter